MSTLVKLGKAGKRLLKKVLPAPAAHVSWVRRVERVATKQRLVAMTFDDGPMDLPANPDSFGGRALTDVLLDTLERHGARGTFDVVGDTLENYPDAAGPLGSPTWGGTKYDHYPDFGQDAHGGAVHNERLLRRMLAGGHQLTNHGYRHIIFGKKPFVYGKRVYLGSYDAAVADLRKLDGLLRERYGYSMKLGRPPHYVDKVEGNLTSYDVYAALGYQYLAASFDGGGWLPSHDADSKAAYEAEVRAMVAPMKAALEADPDALCGQIIFQKDGCNMSKRTPVATALELQLALLDEYGYRVVTVDELMAESPFADVGRDDPDFAAFADLAADRAVAYSDNRLRPDQPMTAGELAMLLTPREECLSRRRKLKKPAYAAALQFCAERGWIPAGTRPDAPVASLPAGAFPKEHFDSRPGPMRRDVLKGFRR